MKLTMRQILATILAILIGGCASALTSGHLRSDVDAFSNGVRSATATYREERGRYVSYYLGLERGVILIDMPELFVGDRTGTCSRAVGGWSAAAGQSGFTSEKYQSLKEQVLSACQLHRTSDDDRGRQLVDLKAGEFDLKHGQLALALERYANALVRLSDSTTDRQSFDAAAAESKDTLLAFLRTAVETSGDTFTSGQEADTIASAINSVIGTELESARRRALAQVVQASHPAVIEAAERLAAITRQYHIGVVPDMRERYIAAVAETYDPHLARNETAYRAAFDRVLEAQQVFYRYVGLDPGLAFDEMVAAHKALGQKLSDPNIDLQALAGQVQYFYKTSDDILEAVRSIRRKIDGESEE